MTLKAVDTKIWAFAQPEATGSNGWAGKAMVAGLHITSVDRGAAFYEDDALLIAAAPMMLREIQETRERLDALLKVEKYSKDNELATALATMEMDLNRVAAIAYGDWPGVRRTQEAKEKNQ